MRRLWWLLLLAFTVVPAVELYTLIFIGTHLGPTATVLIILLTGVVGASLAKAEGSAVLRQIAQDLSQGLPPASRVMEGALVMVGAVLLVTPGVFTDATGFLLILPPTRRLLAPLLLRGLLRALGVAELGDVTLGAPEPIDPGGARPYQGPPPPRQGTLPEGEGPFHHPTR
ncbi:MAG: FxsA family protein [Deltaproteobacteria bacterium]|nr:FxsA family protein [Deltaproteobacteria bacterium]